jgi:glucosamine-6-phosphate deaminase
MKILPLLLLLSQNKTTSGFAAGDLADPHGTHEVCLNTILAAMKQLKSQSYMHDCWLWLYRVLGMRELHEIDMAVPLSPNEVLLKRNAIFLPSVSKGQSDVPRE